jgi:hypothetical protein
MPYKVWPYCSIHLIKRCLLRTLDGGMSQEEVGREGIEPSWVAPGDFKSPASTVSPPPQAGIGSLCA